MKQSKQLTTNQQAALVDVWEGDPFNSSRAGSVRGVRNKTLRYLLMTGYIREDVDFENGKARNVNYKLTLDGREKLYDLFDEDDIVGKLTEIANQIRSDLQLRLVMFGAACWLDLAATRFMDITAAQAANGRVKTLFPEATIQQAKRRRSHVAA